MRSIAAYLPALACGAMMLLVCVPMLLGRKRHEDDDTDASQGIAELREEIERLKSGESVESPDRSVPTARP